MADYVRGSGRERCSSDIHEDGVGIRLIDAAGIGGQVVPGQRICARARATTDLLILTIAALTVAVMRIAQNLEQAGVAVHIHKRISPDISGRYRQEAAG